jgi:signal peptidase II
LRGPGLGRAALVALAVVALDQATKAIVRAEIAPGEAIDLVAGIDLVRVSNDGIAFGLLDGAGSAVLVIAALAFAVLLGVFLAGAERRGLWLPIGLLAGGAVGNLIDRVRDGAVTDFIDPPRWPAFNFADVSITIGVLLLIGIYVVGEEEADGEEGRSGARPGGRPAGP